MRLLFALPLAVLALLAVRPVARRWSAAEMRLGVGLMRARDKRRGQRLDWEVLGCILGALILGAGLLAALVAVYGQLCASRTAVICKMAETSPPWLLLTGIAAAPTAVLTWYWRTVHKKADVENAREAQLTVLFAKAIELLSNEQATTRLGAVYALERIALSSLRDHPVIMETLAGFVRLRTPMYADDVEAPPESEITEDVQAALSVLGRRDTRHDAPLRQVDLSHCDLRGARLELLNLAKISFKGCDLSHVSFQGSNLDSASFRFAVLSQTRFKECTLTGANFQGATLRYANLSSADITGALFDGADMHMIDVDSAVGVTPEILAYVEKDAIERAKAKAAQQAKMMKGNIDSKTPPPAPAPEEESPDVKREAALPPPTDPDGGPSSV